MDDFMGKRAMVGVAVLIGALFLTASIFMGGQTSKILSTVGGAIGNDAQTGTSGDVTDGGQNDPTTAPQAAGGAATDGQVADAGAAIPTLLIVRTGDLALEVADLDAAVHDGDAAVLRAGGYVSGSSRTATADHDAAQVTYRIPSARWDATLAALHGLARKVVSEQIKTDEVTGQVVDLAARIANLRATEAALQAIMAKAAKISDVLDVQKQLTATRGEIEQLGADKQHLEDQASFGSLAVTFGLPVVPRPAATPTPVKSWDPGADAAQAANKLVRIGQTATTAGIWFGIVGIPILLSLAIAALLLRLAWLAVRRTGLVGGREPA